MLYRTISSLLRCTRRLQQTSVTTTDLTSSLRQPISSNMTTSSRFLSTTIKINPKLGLIDDDLHIQVMGLKPGQNVTLEAFLSDVNLKFVSCGHYKADEKGCVDVNKDPALGGTYTGVESTGLIWSMVQAPGQRHGLRLMKKDATAPFDVHLIVHDGHLDVETCYEQQDSDKVLTRQIFNRTYMHPDVTRTKVRHGNLRGTLFRPPGPGPFPVIIDLFGTAGGLIENRAALLASRGFITMPLAYFAYEDLQEYLTEINLDYFEEAVDYLHGLPDSNGKGVGVIGVSKGAEIGLAMAEFMPKVRCVVSINGLSFRSTNPYSYRGQSLPIASPDYGKTTAKDNALYLIDCFDCIIPDEAMIKVEKTNAELLLIASEADGQCPPSCTEQCVHRLQAANKTNYEYHLAKGAGHLLEAPHSPFCRSSYHAKFGMSLLWGGEKVAHTRAQEVAWPKILGFLRKNLGAEGASRVNSRL